MIQIAIIFLFLAVGELVVWATGIPIPSSIIGMVLLAAALQCGAVKLRQVEGAANFLTSNLGFFFVPAGIGVMNCLDLIADQFTAIAVATIGSTICIIFVTGWVHQLTRKLMRRWKS